MEVLGVNGNRIDWIIANCRRDSRRIGGNERRALCDEIERLRQRLSRVVADVELWSVTGRHRSCGCPACEDLLRLAAQAEEALK
jgi:hypothetical protein